MKTLFQDLRYGLRMLRKSPGFTAVVVLTLALGIGANTALFSVINALLLRSLPVQNPHELVQLSMNGGGNPTFNYPIFQKLRDGSRSLPGLFAAGEGTSRRRMVASEWGGSETEFIRTQEVSGNYFSALGVSAQRGRELTADDDREGDPQPVAVLSHRFWQQRFGSDPSAVGKTVLVDDVPLTVVGVAPPGFFGVEVGAAPDLWCPLQLVTRLEKDPSEQRLSKWSWWLRVMGRLPAGTDVRRARAELNTVFQQHMAEEAAMRASEDNRKQGGDRPPRLELESGRLGWTDLRPQLRQPLMVLMAAVGLVLLIACANVASLFLARASARTQEFSIRNALGAGRFRLIRQMLTESVLLAALGGLSGILFAQWGMDFLLSFMQIQSDAAAFDMTPDVRVLAFTSALILLTGLLSGLVYAVRSSRADIVSVLQGSSIRTGVGFGRQKINRGLVVLQMALSLVLLIGAGLFARTLANLKELDAGFNRDNVILFDLDFTKSLDKPSRAAVYKTLLERLKPLPGVQAAGLSVIQPLSGGGWSQQIGAEGYAAAPREDLTCFGMEIGADYFQAMGMPLLNGRGFDDRDEIPFGASNPNAARTVVINETLARRYFQTRNPVGQRLHFIGQPEQTYEVVGVVKDAKYRSLRETTPPTFYVPFFREVNDWGLTYVVRTNGDPRPLLAAIRTAVRETDASVRPRSLRTMDDVVNKSLHRERSVAQLGGFFSLLALGLACLGLYGVLSFAVVQRTREIGVRMALGARQADVLSLVVGQGIRLALAGAALGLLASLALTRLVSSLLYGVNPTDPVTYTGVSLLLLAVALLACYLPARRAARVNPMEALRSE